MYLAGRWYGLTLAGESGAAAGDPVASLDVAGDPGPALPHEQPELLRALLAEWLARVERSS